MKAVLITSLSILLGALATACTPFSPDLGTTPYKCGPADPGPRCPDGYTCMEGNPADPNTHICVAAGETAPDGNPGGFQCLDDSFGMNDTIAGAFQTPVDSQNVTFAALTSLCPAAGSTTDDVDNYAVSLSAPKTLKVTTTWESGMPLNVSILNAGGTSIANGIAGADGKSTCACANSLPTGTYYTKVFAQPGVKNNYRVEIKIAMTSDCTAPPKCN